MTPILYASSETDFSTLGLGVLNDAISCNVRTVLNGMFELEMTYPTTGIRYKDIAISGIIKVESEKGGTPQLFDIYEISKPLNGIITVYASHVSGRKQFIPVMPCSASTITTALQVIKTNSAENNPFTFWTDKTTVANFSVNAPKSLGQCLGGSEGSLLDVYGGEYEFDNFTIRLWNRRGQDNGVSLRYGKNITSIEQEESIASTITGICPYWADDSGNIVIVPEKVVQSSRADNFPFKRSVVVDFTQDFDEAPTVAQLRSAAQSYITSNNIGVPTVGMDISYENLADYEEYKDIAVLEQVRLGDTVHVYFEPLDIEASARIVETRYDCLLEKYDRVRVGSIKTSFSNAVVQQTLDETKKEIAKSSTALERAFENAVDALSGADGGYVVIRRNEATNQPYEILIMDTDNISTAQKVLRLNNAGLGYSKNGIAGQYTAAITGDGIAANAITTGYLNAARIEANSIAVSKLTGSISNGSWKIDLDAGTMTLGKLAVGSITGLLSTTSTTGNSWGINFTNGTINIGTISADKISAGTIDASSITITNIDGENINSGSVGSTQLGSGAVTTVKIANGAITAGKIDAGAVTTAKLDAGAVTADKIAADAVTADKIKVTDLQAIGATIGAFHIDSNSLYSGTKDAGIADGDVTIRGSGTFTRAINGTDRANLKFAIGSKFGIGQDGSLYASGVNVSGTIESNSATITGGSFKVGTADKETTSYIKLTYSTNYYAEMFSGRLVVRNSDNGHQANYEGGGVIISDYITSKTRTSYTVDGIIFWNSSGIATGSYSSYRDSGYVGSWAVPANSSATKTISFSKTFPSVPEVFVRLTQSANNAIYGSCNLSVYNITRTGFTVRAFNNTSIEVGMPFDWATI